MEAAKWTSNGKLGLTTDQRDLKIHCAYLEERVFALVAALERERQLRRDLEVVVGNFLHENAMLREIIRFQESLESF